MELLDKVKSATASIDRDFDKEEDLVKVMVVI